ncbi:CBN-RNR-2 protein [Aphelenchoides avenae]|nr:CBN-RNR-2 protein [Aphelenchus avenae]
MRVTVNGREVFHANGLYAYKAYLDSELSFSVDNKHAQLSAGGYFVNDIVNQDSDANDSFLCRRKLFSGGKTVQLLTQLHADIFNQARYMVSNVDIDVEILPHESDFVLQTLNDNDDNTYGYEIRSCKLYAKMLSLTDGLNLSIANQLASEPARYPMKKAELKSENINAGRKEVNTTLFTEILPRRLVVGFVETSAYVGHPKKSPFMFKNFGIREITVMAHGQNFPNIPYNLSWTTSQYGRAFHDMHEAVALPARESNGITMDMYRNGWTLFVFNLSTTQDSDEGFDLIKNGPCHINVKFDGDGVPAGGVTMIVYGESDTLLMIDHSRSVISDLTA